MPSALVAVADGSEDIEFSCIADILARGEVKVTVASVMESRNVSLSRGIKVTADCLISEVSASNFDAAFLPGGLPGAEHFGKSEGLKKFMQELKQQNKLYGAICAAPVLSLGPLGMLEGVKTATCYPSMESKFPSFITHSTKNVVKCGNCLTSRGPGTSMLFGLAAVACLRSKEVAQKVAEGLLLQGPEVDAAISQS
eukprot:gene5829-4156_t